MPVIDEVSHKDVTV